MADEHLISLQPGTVIAGRYEVVKCLGQGSMGLVYACRHRELHGHMVAVKVLFPEVAQDKKAAQRFRNEIFASYGVSHPNVVRAYDYIRDGELVAYTMEYVGGGDLAGRLSAPDDLLAISDIISLLSQMCLGVQAIHDAGIVHRDLKPENILISKEGQVKIADFGIARTGHGPKLTEHGGVVGTIDYVSPEYMLNSHVDWRSDIYALGILAYEMITGESPFHGDSVYATMTKRLKSDPKPPSSIRSECPGELDRIVLKAMARDPETRYQAALEMYQDLEALRRDMGFANSVPPPSPRGDDPVLSTRVNPSYDLVNPDPLPPSDLPFVESPTDTFVDRSRPQPTRPPREQAPEPTTHARQYARDDERTSNAESGPEKLQSVLSRFTSWEDNSAGREVFISHSGIDGQRLQRLSQAVTRVDRALWVDILTWTLALLLGVGVGFAFLRVFFPELLDRSHAEAYQLEHRAACLRVSPMSEFHVIMEKGNIHVSLPCMECTSESRVFS